MKKIFLILCLVFSTGLAVELSRAGELDLGLSYLSGITEKRLLAISLQAEKGTVSGSTEIRYAQEEGAVSENGGHIRLGYDPKISERWSLWFLDQLGYDERRGIDLENFAGGGPKYTFEMLDSKLKTSLSAGLLQHHIRYEDDPVTNTARLSLRPKLRYQISNDLSFRLVAFYQPNIEDFEDYIIIGETSLKYDLTKKAGLKIKVEDEYRSVSRCENNDLRAVLALAIYF